ncbi:MAG TPA: acetyl-CoA carboxylase biotin carboxylase subunit [Planctomycetota bacterium]|nr:acetyl-CoA carboxylase biotin carboxylase subunit [Planctomycetota bacterium]
MLKRILIANRGEIALRIIRACKELGIETIAVYSQEDRNAIYLRYADETICIGPAAAGASYLDIPRIISAAEIADVEAIHPGYGFLSENEHFAEVCRSCGIVFIGPPTEAIANMGNKSVAREMAAKAGVPITRGSEGLLKDENQGLEVARKIGFPVMIKAAAGGGGRGMRVAHNEISFVNGFLAARAEAENAFKDGSLYVEKYIQGARHIEIQLIGDRHGNLVHLGERDCSIQRRHQKLIEEAPSPFVDEDLRKRMGEAAVAIARAANYENAGTIEFLVDKDRNFYFMEMNTRIQVEHPVTEMVTGFDLVKEQIRVASGYPLSFKQSDVRFEGHAIECRINAEDPENGFKPSPGKIGLYFPPGGEGVRVDSHCYSGFSISPCYDSMVGKLIIHRPTREEAIHGMRRALGEYVIEGIKTTIPLHARIMNSVHYQRGNVNTTFVEEYFLRQ